MTTYAGSEAYKAVCAASTECLQNKMRYVELAIDFHEKNNSASEVQFFTDCKAHIEKSLAEKRS